jgi:hypothetical protein
MAKRFAVGSRVALKPGSPSYKHFINYMPVTGEIINHDETHTIGQAFRPWLVRFDDDRESWYAKNELVLI